jgi:hypothetical protein
MQAAEDVKRQEQTANSREREGERESGSRAAQHTLPVRDAQREAKRKAKSYELSRTDSIAVMI